MVFVPVARREKFVELVTSDGREYLLHICLDIKLERVFRVVCGVRALEVTTRVDGIKDDASVLVLAIR